MFPIRLKMSPDKAKKRGLDEIRSDSGKSSFEYSEKKIENFQFRDMSRCNEDF